MSWVGDEWVGGRCVRGAHCEDDFEIAVAVWEEEDEDGGAAREGELVIACWRWCVAAEAREGLLEDG